MGGHPYTAEQEAVFKKQLETLECLASEMGSIKRRPKLDQEAMAEEGGWMDAVEVVYFVNKVVTAAQHTLKAAGSLGASSPKVAWQLHDALLVAFNFGYMPPLRPSVIVTVRHHDAALPCPSRCQAAGCSIKGCKGNRLELLPAGGYLLVLPHHKNARRWGNKVVRFTLPSELTWLVQAWASHGWGRLRAHDAVDTLFFNSHGTPLTTTTLANKWNQLLQGQGFSVHLPPRRLRHIFAAHRMENPDVPGPSHEHAAVVMGNSVTAWKRHYHTMHDHLGAQQAVDRMTEYREACLKAMGAKPAEMAALEAGERVAEAVVLFQLEEEEGEEDEEEAIARAQREREEAYLDAVDLASADTEGEEEDSLEDWEWSEDESLGA